MEDIKITEGTILESLNNKADIDGGNYKGSGLQAVLEETTLGTAGGTLTGALTLQNKLNFKRSNTLDYTDTNHTTVSETAGEIYFRDKNDKIVGYIQTYFNEYNNMGLSTSTRRSIDGTLKTAQTQIYVDVNGNANFTFPMCTTKATTRSSATTGRVAVVTQNYVSGTSWYRVWSDGWIEQGGYKGSTSAGSTVKLLKNFSNTNYTLVATVTSTGNHTCPISSRTVSSFVAFQDFPVSWYACGY